MDQILALLGDPKVLALVSPLIVSLVKQLTSKVPSWALPLLSVLVGAVGAGLTGTPVVAGAVAGAAGIGIRELVDQAKKAAAPAAK